MSGLPGVKATAPAPVKVTPTPVKKPTVSPAASGAVAGAAAGAVAGTTVQQAGDTKIVTVDKPILVSELPNKPFWKSDTIIVNGVTLLAMVFADATGISFIKNLVQEHPEQILIGVNAANIYLRSRTKQGVSLGGIFGTKKN
jgi:hypothetical protein